MNSEHKDLRLWLWTSEATLRNKLIEHIPIGTPVASVEQFLNTRISYLERMGSAYTESNGVKRRIPEDSMLYDVVGVRSIKIWLGTYNSPSSVFLLKKNVFVSWAFDEDDLLIDVFVDKLTVAP